jgi:hypothetical protein
LAKNGTRTERGKCPRAQSPSTPEACREERPGGPEDKAAAIALARCGGPDDCILLYLNDRKVADVAIAVQ